MKLWGVVSEVNEKDIVVSLPGGLRGLVRASEAVPPFVEDGAKLVLNLLTIYFLNPKYRFCALYFRCIPEVPLLMKI